MAFQIAEGAEEAGLNAILKKVEQCTLDDLTNAEGIAVGSPTQYGNMAWQIKKFLDETILSFYSKGHSLKNKVCACFTSTGGYSDGKDCARTLELAFGFALKMKLVPSLILESKDVGEGSLGICYNFGRRIAKEMESPNLTKL